MKLIGGGNKYRSHNEHRADALTVDELQKKSLFDNHLLISNWLYAPFCMYLALSTVRTSNILFVRIPILHSKTNT